MSLLRRTLERSRARLGSALSAVLPGRRVSDAAIDELEGALLSADVGPTVAADLIDAVRAAAADGAAARRALAERMIEILAGAPKTTESAPKGPQVVLVVGVNGTGKTTTCAKLVRRCQQQGQSVILGAADTFRAAAAEQLATWAQRLDVPLIAQQTGGDPAAVAFDTCEAARARGLQVAIIDTAGRLHTHSNLMAELDKLRRVVGKVVDGAPHEVLLVLDATTGQNGLRQAQEFLAHAGVTGLVLSKLDGTAKGGVALAIAQQYGLPVRFVGTGEAVDDLAEFDPAAYVDGLLGGGEQEA